jgi:hypothetical protein
MEIQLPVRWSTHEIDRDKLKRSRLMGNDTDEMSAPIKTKYERGYLVVNLDHVQGFNSYGKSMEYTVLRVYPADSFLVTIPFEDFKKIYTKLKGTPVIAIEELIAEDNGQDELKDLSSLLD